MATTVTHNSRHPEHYPKHFWTRDFSRGARVVFEESKKHWLGTFLWAATLVLSVGLVITYHQALANAVFQVLTSAVVLHTVALLQFLLMVSGIVFMASVLFTSFGLLLAVPVMGAFYLFARNQWPEFRFFDRDAGRDRVYVGP